MSRLRSISLVMLVLLNFFIFFLNPQSAKAAENKCGVNVGPYYNQVSQVKSLTKNGGWIVVLGSLGQCADYSSVFGQGLNVVLRAYNEGKLFDEPQADAWVATLHQLDTKGQKVYFMPWNEPNHDNEGGNSTAGATVKRYTDYLTAQLRAAGLLGTKVEILSPMVDKLNPSFGGQFFTNPGGISGFYNGFIGSSINEYDHANGDTSYSSACTAAPPANNCMYDTLGIPPPFYALEAGVAGTGEPPLYRDNQIALMLNTSWSRKWQTDTNFEMFAVFSYDPHRSGDWDIYTAPQTKTFYSNSCTVGSVQSSTSVDENKFTNWYNPKQSQLVACASGCGFAPSSHPELCNAAGKNENNFEGYDTSLYDDYDTVQDQFYIHPIKGLNRAQDGSQGAFDANLKTIRDDLITQGYESRCATPGFNIELTQDGKDWMADYVEQNPPGAVFGGHENYIIRTRVAGDPPGIGDYVRSWLAVDYREVQTPVFRDVSDKRFLMTSLEEFFGFKDTVVQEQSPAELNSAAINSLLTNQQRCEASVRILLRQEEMCNKLANPNACALYSRPVPQTNFTIKTMLEAYKALVAAPPSTIKPNPLPPYTDPATIKAICSELVGSDWNETAREGLLYTPLTIDRAYRLAFLVTTIEVFHATYKSMFNLYIHPNEGPAEDGPSKPDDAVLVNAFKVPDILTTTQLESAGSGGSGNTAWTDSSKLTRNSLLTKKNQDVLTKTVNAKVAELKKAAEHYDTNKQESGADEIYCLEGVSNRGIGPPECKDELGKAVIDIINAQASNRVTTKYDNQIDAECPELIKEPASSILDFGSFGTVETIKNPPAELLYTQEFGAKLLHNIFEVPEKNQDPAGLLDSSHQIEPKGDSHPSFAETWKPGDPRAETNDIAPGEPNSEWGLKSLFHVTDRTYPRFPYNACCDVSEVKHFLVYPMGYDMQKVQEVLAGTFFTTDQIASLTTAAEEFDRIQLSGDQIDFTGGTREIPFSDTVKGEPIEGNKLNWPDGVDFISVNDPIKDSVFEIDRCQKVYETKCKIIDPITNIRSDCHIEHVGWELPCDRPFGWTIKQKGSALTAGLLGGRFGFWLREIQKGLNTKAGTAREYLDTCKTVEQFLTGHCGQPVDPVPTPDPPDPNCTELSCTPPTPVPPTATPMPPTPMPTTLPQPGCAYSACFSMCANRNATGTVTVNFAWTGDSTGCACGDISDNEIIINGTSHGQPTCINVISSSMPNRSCSFDNQPANTIVCRKKGRYYCTEPFCDACREQSDLEMCVVAVQQ